MSALLELAERCEKATGPDRQLDGEIVVALRLVPGSEGWVCNFSDWRAHRETVAVYDNGKLVCHWHTHPRYTASIDAARTLVPDAHSFVVHGPHEGRWSAGCDLDFGGMWKRDREATEPALALCAAALRARANTGGHNDPL